MCLIVISQIITKIDVDHEHLLGSTVELNAMHHACGITYPWIRETQFAKTIE